MPDMMVLVSKGELEKAYKHAKVGDVLPFAGYDSASKALQPAAGASMFLVTVRPPDEQLWLVAILETPAFDGARWKAPQNRIAVTDLAKVRDKLCFANGKGLVARPGALGMSLQTPRVLTGEDVELLRNAAGAGAKPGAAEGPASKKPRAAAKAGEADGRPANAAAPAGKKPEAATKAATTKPAATAEAPAGEAVPAAKPARAAEAPVSKTHGATTKPTSVVEASPSKKTDAPAKAEAPLPRGTGNLGAASEALSRGDRAAALTSLLAAWRGCRAASVEAVIDVVSADVARAHAAIEAPAREFDAAWNARVAARDPAELPLVLDVVTHDPKGSLPLRLRALLELPPDPRLGQAMLAMIDEPPITASSNFSMWTMLFAALPKYVDARAKKRLEARAKKPGGTSQFWPKLVGWIEKVIPQLSPPASPSPGDEALLDAMRARARELAKGAAPEATAPRAAPRGPAPTRTPQELLEAAENGVGAGDPAGALDALVAFWGERRAPEVADLIDRLGHVVDDTLPGLEVGKPSEIHAGWLAIARPARAADVGRLLASVTAGKLADADERLTAIVQWQPDPRVGRRLALLFEDYMLGSRPVFWKLVYDAFVHHADPRQKQLLVERADAMETRAAFDRVRSERAQLRRIREPFVTACDRPFALAPAERASVERIAAALETLRARRKSTAESTSGNERAIVRAIADAMDDDTPRLVYADMLSERGDPRGEYIAMAIADATGTAKLKSKLETHFKKHRAALHGPLASFVYKSDFARGLLETLQVDDKGMDWNDPELTERALSDFRWCTLRRLSFFSHRDRREQREILGRAPLWSLTHIEDIELEELAILAERGPHPTLAEVELRSDGSKPTGDPWPALAAATFPALTRVKLSWHSAPPAPFFATPIFRHLRALEAGSRHCGGVLDLGEWIPPMREASFPVPTVRATCHLLTLEWNGPTQPSVARFHHGLSDKDDEDWTPLFEGLEAARRVKGTKLHWTADKDAKLSKPFVSKLESLAPRLP